MSTPSKQLDPAHKYATPDPKKYGCFHCNFCGKITNGGVSRAKHHLAGGYNDVTLCPKVPDHVNEEVKTFLKGKQDAVKAKASVRMMEPAFGYDDEEDDVYPTQPNLKKRKGPMDRFVAPTPPDVLKGRKDRKEVFGGVSDKESRDKACRAIERWFIDAGIPFYAITYDSFKEVCELIGQYGSGFKPPSMYELRVPLLKKEVEEAEKQLVEYKADWVAKGCSIMSDGWRDSVVQKDIINFLVNSPKGSVFLKSVDVSEVVKDANLLFNMLDNVVDEVGESNVVQLVTDNASNYIKAGKLLMAKRPHLYWSPCAAHCLDLMLEDIGQIPSIKAAIKSSIFMNGYIYTRPTMVNTMRRFTGGGNLHRPAVTRFATSFITLSSYYRQKNNLRKFVNSQEWIDSKWSKELGAKKVKQIIMQDSFWRNILYALGLTTPLVKVLRLVDGEKKPAMGYIYEAMDRAKETIAQTFNHREDQYQRVFEIIDERWNCQLHQPLHAAGHFLNPEFQYKGPEVNCEEVMKGLYDAIGRLVPKVTTQDVILKELEQFKNASGLFGHPMAIRQRATKAPAEWWWSYGASTPTLRDFAVIVRVFVNKREMETEIVNRLGNGFSRAPFATVVGLCTAVSMLALFPLGELFFFHMLLIKKGITTYEYVVAMRAMSEVPPGASVDEEMPNVLYSPSGSATTGFSGGSSLGLSYKGAWCTPPRVFVDYQDEVIPHLDPGMVPSTVDPDATESAERGNKIPKRPVKLSAWKLAKLNSNEATRAAARARASSSVLRPIENRHAQDDELSSSGTMSVVSSVSADANAAAMRNNDPRLPLSRNSFAPSHGSKDEYETETHSMSSFSSPSHVHEAVSLSPLPQYHTAGNRFAAGASSNAPRPPLNPGMIHSTFDEKIMQKGNKADPVLHPAPAPAASLLRDVRRTSVVWDQEAGRYVSVPATTSEARTRLASHHQPIPSSHTQNPRSVLPPQDSSSGKAPLHPPPPQQGEKLMYTGDSIFFGGPLVNIPNRDGLRNEGDSGREGQDRMTLALPREARFRRDTTSNQLPVFAPVGTRK